VLVHSLRSHWREAKDTWHSSTAPHLRLLNDKFGAISMRGLMDPRIGGRIKFSGGVKGSRISQIMDLHQINDHDSLQGHNLLEH
jgi:hypothetical protein